MKTISTIDQMIEDANENILHWSNDGEGNDEHYYSLIPGTEQVLPSMDEIKEKLDYIRREAEFFGMQVWIDSDLGEESLTFYKVGKSWG